MELRTAPGAGPDPESLPFASIAVRRAGPLLQVTLKRPAQNNAIDAVLLAELGALLDCAEADPRCRAVVLQGADGVFCTGIDFDAAAAVGAGAPAARTQAGAYFDLLRRLSDSPLVLVAKVDGMVAGGGVGLVAACDLVVATGRSSFSLPEALWGLLPCCVLPFLIRRVGFQPAYRMALTTQHLGAAAAQQCQLVDVVDDDAADAVRRLLLRTLRAEAGVVAELKALARAAHPITREAELRAVEALCRLLARPETAAGISAFVERGVFPWEGAGAGCGHD